MTTAEFDLERFVTAQDANGIYAQAVSELRQGRKTSHWMWFVFPQVAGLGRSAMAQRFAIASRAEALAFLAHPVLGSRLVTCSQIVAGTRNSTAGQIFGVVDAQKLHSSMTLFQQVGPDDSVFGQVLERYFGGRLDPATIERLRE